MRIFSLAVSLAILSAQSLTAAPPRPTIQLTPTGPWNIDYTPLSCNLQRPMVAAGDPYAFALTIEPLDTPITLTITHAEKVDKRDSGDATVFVDGVAQSTNAHFNFFKSPAKLAVREYLLNFGQHGLGAAKNRLRLQSAKRGDFELTLPQLRPAIVALAKCKVDLHSSLGITPAQLKAVAVQPGAFDYGLLSPPRNGDKGVDFILFYWVTEGGKIDKCRLLKPSGFKPFDETVCPILEQKALVIPAKDAAGRPVRAPAYQNLHVRVETFTTTEPL
jgi:hypothetical protein